MAPLVLSHSHIAASGGVGGAGGSGGGVGGEGGGKQGKAEAGISHRDGAANVQSCDCQPYSLSMLVVAYMLRSV